MREYNKLVRDRIPEVLQAAGKRYEATQLTESEYLDALGRKLLEEAQEAQDGLEADELADVLEIVLAIAQAKGITAQQLEAIRIRKREERGGFEDQVFLIRAEP